MPPIHVALTGNIAAGKSTVLALFKAWGASVIDADGLAREVQLPGTAVFQAIVARFGPEIVSVDGTLDRPRLRARVMADPAERRALEAIVHPAVQELREEAFRNAAARGDRIVVSDIPLLFEVLDPGAFDAVVLVDAPEPVRLARLKERGLDEKSALAMIRAQLPAVAKRGWRGGPRRRGPLIIENDGDRDELERRARVVWEEVIRAG